MMKREDIDGLLASDDLPENVREQLSLVGDARNFAAARLGLPDNGSYTSYVQLDREYVLWNVFAAPEFSLDPRLWCFPVAGCVAYRGHFKKARAEKEARKLRSAGFDAYVGGVPAYSTLGRFKDPVINTMLTSRPEDLVATLFHELAHQKLYVQGDTVFNESFATAVAETGLIRWLDRRNEASLLAGYQQRRERHRMFVELADAARADLTDLYQQDISDADMREKKERLFSRLGKRYSELARSLGLKRYPRPPDSNAALVPIASYNDLVPGFRALLSDCDGDLACFYAASDALAKLPGNEDRANALNRTPPDQRPASRLNCDRRVLRSMPERNTGARFSSEPGARPKCSKPFSSQMLFMVSDR